jgi:hypothetical protein
MSRCPFAKPRILHPENERAPLIVPRAVILHTAVDAVGHTDLAAYEDREDVGSRVHFFIHRDGAIDQLLDTNRRGAAGGISDAWALHVETEDDSARRGSDVLPLTDDQTFSFIRVCDWAIREHSTIPRRRCTSSSGAGAHGIGYHSQPMRERWEYKLANGIWRNSWTSYQGKVCPGDAKIAQYESVILPALLGHTSPTPAPPVHPEDPDVTPEECSAAIEAYCGPRFLDLAIRLEKIRHELNPDTNESRPARRILERLSNDLDAVREKLGIARAR